MLEQRVWLEGRWVCCVDSCSFAHWDSRVGGSSGLAAVHLIRAGMILSDIDAHWGVVEETEDDSAVYLDWLAKDNPHRLRLLRQSWRLHRWVTIGLWIIGGVAALMQWMGDEFQVMLVSGFVATTFVIFPAKLLQHEPQWLQWSLGIQRFTQWRAVMEVCGLIWLSYCIPICLVQVFTGDVSIYFFGALLWMVPLSGLVAWLDLGGRRKQGIALGMLGSAGMWLSVIGMGG